MNNWPGVLLRERVVLFGSSLSPAQEYRDIDIGVEGIEEKDFYTFYGELLCALSKPVDIIDLSKKTRFIELILREGVPLYAIIVSVLKLSTKL